MGEINVSTRWAPGWAVRYIRLRKLRREYRTFTMRRSALDKYGIANGSQRSPFVQAAARQSCAAIDMQLTLIAREILGLGGKLPAPVPERTEPVEASTNGWGVL